MPAATTTLSDTYFVSPATGRRYWIDAFGSAFRDEEDDGSDWVGCECEQDYHCGCGRYASGTWLETRYDGDDDPRGY
jgi:hypothetical protein